MPWSIDQALNQIQASNGVQQPNGAQAPNGVQPPTQTSIPLSPLGEPVRRSSALLAEDPLTWHLRYWLSLSVIGLLRGEDPILMAFRIEREHFKFRDLEFRDALMRDWRTYRVTNHAECQRNWGRLTLESEEAKPFLRDIDRMLVDKGPKTREHLHRLQSAMVSFLRATEIDTARAMFERIAQIYQKLEEEETVDEQARNRQPNGINGTSNATSNGTNGVHDHDGQEHVDSDEDMSDEDETNLED